MKTPRGSTSIQPTRLGSDSRHTHTYRRSRDSSAKAMSPFRSTDDWRPRAPSFRCRCRHRDRYRPREGGGGRTGLEAEGGCVADRVERSTRHPVPHAALSRPAQTGSLAPVTPPCLRGGLTSSRSSGGYAATRSAPRTPPPRPFGRGGKGNAGTPAQGCASRAPLADGSAGQTGSPGRQPRVY
jgi:hypothetical protein